MQSLGSPLSESHTDGAEVTEPSGSGSAGDSAPEHSGMVVTEVGAEGDTSSSSPNPTRPTQPRRDTTIPALLTTALRTHLFHPDRLNQYLGVWLDLQDTLAGPNPPPTVSLLVSQFPTTPPELFRALLRLHQVSGRWCTPLVTARDATNPVSLGPLWPSSAFPFTKRGRPSAGVFFWRLLTGRMDPLPTRNTCPRPWPWLGLCAGCTLLNMLAQVLHERSLGWSLQPQVRRLGIPAQPSSPARWQTKFEISWAASHRIFPF